MRSSQRGAAEKLGEIADNPKSRTCRERSAIRPRVALAALPETTPREIRPETRKRWRLAHGSDEDAANLAIHHL